ncbi:HNH endonuclease [Coraliomargarita akajimensis]|uniref:HNH endonuclease n=1 Tax=Coraliomargarita akajimensis (strain DSM 45221 / IAM 15411 / JCM 23193 / KCTC 12865 / 04OKA010-24) TaxID=583355 RepID=D5EMU3_CORAD|nr:HNH endonuclease [Coraliomargarita akajimensis]ADE55333.1 HNH endonuclease [Coraliomargarita akajimensis DSM 45221]
MGTGLKYRVLVLNRLWQPVNIIGVQRAFSLLLQDHAQAINTRDGQFQMMSSAEWLDYCESDVPEANEAYLQTVKLRIRVPKVLLLREYSKLPVQEVKFTRENLFERDNYRCQYCGDSFEALELNMDHVIPRDKGGRTSWENIVTSCIQCNSRKANRLPHQASMHLIRKPERPRQRPFISSLIGNDCDEAWEHFIGTKKAM